MKTMEEAQMVQTIIEQVGDGNIRGSTQITANFMDAARTHNIIVNNSMHPRSYAVLFIKGKGTNYGFYSGHACDETYDNPRYKKAGDSMVDIRAIALPDLMRVLGNELRPKEYEAPAVEMTVAEVAKKLGISKLKIIEG
jgi:hypothetical protein